MSKLYAGNKQQMAINNNKVNDTVESLSTCENSFSLASNSHGNCYIKIKYHFIKNCFFIKTTDPF